MVRKVIALSACFAILLAFGLGSQASAYSVYDGNMSNTYVQYFRDIVSGLGFTEHYVCFRSGQYEYTMVTGDLEYNGTSFTGSGDLIVYTFDYDGSYNSSYDYNVTTINNFSLTPNNRIIYSDLGQFPQLETRGEKYEILSAFLVIVALLGIVIYSIFRPR